MATATGRRYTPEDLLLIDDRPMPELIDGDLVEREPMGQEADAIAARIIAVLILYSKVVPGLVNGSQGGYQVFPDDPKKVRIPDVSFTRKDRITSGRSARGHARIRPDLAVEVISPNDLAAKLLAKLEDYGRAEIPWVWIVNPDDRRVTTRTIGEIPRSYGPGEMIGDHPSMPGFRCAVDDLFED